MLLELAHLIPHLPAPPQRPLTLVAFDAEEVGAQGSHALACQFKAEEKMPLVLNLDGAACQNEAVWVEPGANTEPLLQALDQAGRWLDIPLIQGNIASDQRQFTREGFSSVGLSVGAAKLHTPADTIELVQPAALDTAARLLLATMWQLAWEALVHVLPIVVKEHSSETHASSFLSPGCLCPLSLSFSLRWPIHDVCHSHLSTFPIDGILSSGDQYPRHLKWSGASYIASAYALMYRNGNSNPS